VSLARFIAAFQKCNKGYVVAVASAVVLNYQVESAFESNL
jgi:hypothetical protein